MQFDKSGFFSSALSFSHFRMRGTAVALATLAATATAGVVTIPLQRRTSPAPGLVKRGSVSVGLADLLRDVFYVGEVEIGTPPVSFTLQLDTGSIVCPTRS